MGIVAGFGPMVAAYGVTGSDRVKWAFGLFSNEEFSGGSSAIFHIRHIATSVVVWIVFAEYNSDFDSVHLGLQQHIR